jgi:hypothetical protein
VSAAPFHFGGFRAPHYTQTPDEVFDVLLPVLSGAELKVLLYIIRRTFGWRRDADAISLSQIMSGITRADGTVVDAGTGLAKSTAIAAIKGLGAKGVVEAVRTRSAARGFESTTYRPCMAGLSDNRTRLVQKDDVPLVRQSDIQQTAESTHKNGSGNNVLVENEVRRFCKARGWPPPTAADFAVMSGMDVTQMTTTVITQAALGARSLGDLLDNLRERRYAG